jgi:hypothetical protein
MGVASGKNVRTARVRRCATDQGGSGATPPPNTTMQLMHVAAVVHERNRRRPYGARTGMSCRCPLQTDY